MSFAGEFATAARSNPNGLAVVLEIILNEATWALGDGTLSTAFNVSDRAVSARTRAYDARVTRAGWSGIRQTIELRAAGLSGLSTTVTLADEDGRVRDALVNGNNRNSPAKILRVVPGSIDDYDTRFTGLLDSWEFSRNQVKLNLKTDERNLKANFPAWSYLQSEWFNMDPQFNGKYIPLVYGKHDSTALNLDHGMVPTVPVWKTSGWFASNLGPATLIKDVYVTNSSSTVKQAYTVAGAGGNAYEKVYGSLAGAKIFTIAEFINIPSTDTTVTMDLYGYSLGVETPYDASNTMTNPVAQIRHFLVNFAVERSRGYIGGSSWDSVDPLIDSASWDAAVTYADNHGLEGSRYMDDVKTALARLTEWCESFPAFRPFWSSAGAIEMAILTTDWPGYWDGATDLIRREDTIGSAYRYTTDPMDITNKISVQYLRDSVGAKFLRSLDVQDPSSAELADTSIQMFWAPSRQA
jgi:hypothetical protein